MDNNSAEINSLNKSKKKYVNMRDKIINALSKLKSAYNKLDNVSSLVINGYSIDGNSADEGYLSKTKNEILSSYNKLNSILATVNNKIKEIDSNIKVLGEE